MTGCRVPPNVIIAAMPGSPYSGSVVTPVYVGLEKESIFCPGRPNVFPERKLQKGTRDGWRTPRKGPPGQGSKQASSSGSLNTCQKKF